MRRAEDSVLYSCGRGDEFQLGLSDAPLVMETRDLALEYLMESRSQFIVRVPTPVSNLEGIKVPRFTVVSALTDTLLDCKHFLWPVPFCLHR